MTAMSRPIVCFGEILLRLSAPGAEDLLQTPRLDVHVGGAEANVAVALARWGQDARMVSVLPDDRLGAAALGELRKHGVDTRGITRGPGRMGLYFLSPGAVLRPSEVLYDRAHSAFASAPADRVDWDVHLGPGARLHLSGITPAVGPLAAQAALRAVDEARRLGADVSFDGNYRAKLWAAWAGDGPQILRAVFERADLAFADDRDIALILGQRFDDPDPQARRAHAAAAAFAAFPRLSRIASTIRTTHGVDHHEMSAVLFTRAGVHRARTFALSGIIDRIGAGDAFAAGVLHGLARWGRDDAALDFGLAAACLKHAIPGDFCLATEAEVEALVAGAGLDVRR